MENAKANHKLGDKEFNCRLWKYLVDLLNLEKLAALDKWHDEIEAKLSLKAVMHAAKERMVGLEKDVSLCSCQFNNTLL